MENVYLLLYTTEINGKHGTYIEDVFRFRTKAENMAEVLEFEKRWEETNEHLVSEAEEVNNTAVRYFKTKDGGKLWVCIVEMPLM